MEEITILFLLFIIYSFVGWLIETCKISVSQKKIINRGFLIGPYCPIYGCGCVLILLLLSNFANDWQFLLIDSIAICGVLEYVTSFLMEKIFKTRWWDYSNDKLNINGRVCVRNLIAFGIGSCAIIYFVNPAIMKVLITIPIQTLSIIAIIFAFLFTIDLIISFNIIAKFNPEGVLEIKDNTEEVTKHVKKYLKRAIKNLNKRLMLAFPEYKQYKKSK